MVPAKDFQTHDIRYLLVYFMYLRYVRNDVKDVSTVTLGVKFNKGLMMIKKARAKTPRFP